METVAGREIIRRMSRVLLLIAFMFPPFVSAQDGTSSQGPATFRVRKLAFDVTSGDIFSFKDDIFVPDPPNSKPRRLVGGMHPVWSPDGEKIAYCVRSGIGTNRIGEGQMHFINADGSGDKQVTNLEGGACPSDWSANGRLAFESKGVVYVMSADGNYGVKLSPGYGPRWSPDGKKLVFCRSAGNRQSSDSIWIINTDGTDARKVMTIIHKFSKRIGVPKGPLSCSLRRVKTKNALKYFRSISTEAMSD